MKKHFLACLLAYTYLRADAARILVDAAPNSQLSPLDTEMVLDKVVKYGLNNFLLPTNVVVGSRPSRQHGVNMFGPINSRGNRASDHELD